MIFAFNLSTMISMEINLTYTKVRTVSSVLAIFDRGTGNLISWVGIEIYKVTH